MDTSLNRAFARNVLSTAVMTAATCLALASSALAAESVEVIHWWTSSGETAAVGKFKEAFTAKGFEWKDLAVGGADNQRMLLKARVGKGSSPDAAQINSDVRAYAADRSNLANLDALAAKRVGTVFCQHPFCVTQKWADLATSLFLSMCIGRTSCGLMQLR